MNVTLSMLANRGLADDALARFRTYLDGRNSIRLTAATIKYMHNNQILPVGIWFHWGMASDTPALRKLAVQQPALAYLFARKISGPDDEMREAASKDPHHALLFAEKVDKGPHQVTRDGVKGTRYATAYDRLFAKESP